MNRTRIEWTDYTWNPVTGCTNNCPFCYARRLANGRLKARYLANPNVAFGCDKSDPFSPRLWSKRFGAPCHLKKPSKIFVVDMGDLFGPAVPSHWQQVVLDIVKRCPQHTFQFLTKFPQLLPRDFPDNTWVGTTVTCDKDTWRISSLLNVRARKRFVSFEPLLGPIGKCRIDLIDWIIIGAQTNPNKQPDAKWVNAIVEAAGEGAPIFIKNNLEMDEDFRPRQFPLEAPT